MPVNLPVSAPSAAGVDAAGVLRFLDAIAAEPSIEPHSLAVLRRGRLVVEGYWAPYQPEDRSLVYSVSKTLTATAVGLAVGAGMFALDDRVVDLIPEDVPQGVSDRVREITVHHLLSMSTGRDEDSLPALQALPLAEWAWAYLSMTPAGPVGSRHVYDNGASWLCGELVRRASGQGLVEFLRPRLLEPLGIEDLTWDTDDLGRELGWTGVHITTRGLAALGELYRLDGVWQGHRILPEGWVAELSSKQIPTVDVENRDWGYGYGYQVWMGREGFRLDGAFGQFVFVLPERDAVIALTSAQSFTQRLIDLVWEHLVPALEAGGDDAADAALEARLRTLALPAVPDAGRGTSWEAGGFAVDPTIADHPEEQSNLPLLYSVFGTREGDGWTRLSLGYHETRPTVSVPGPGWHRTQMEFMGPVLPMAVSIGSDLAGTLEARLRFVESPHMLILRIDQRGVGRVAWNVPPLHSNRLGDLGAGEGEMPD